MLHRDIDAEFALADEHRFCTLLADIAGATTLLHGTQCTVAVGAPTCSVLLHTTRPI